MDLREHFLQRHVLAQVVAEGLPTVGRYPIIKGERGTLNNCVSSTRIAKAVCDHYAIPAVAAPCRLLAWNRQVQARMNASGGVFVMPETNEELFRMREEDGSWFKGAGLSDDAGADNLYPGHVVLVVNGEWVVDMTADQCQDPRHGILPEPLTFPAQPFFTCEWFAFWHEESGTGVAYQAAPEKPPFEDTPAWRDTRGMEPIVAEIVAELDDLDPQTVIRSSVWNK
jgi:hypothetical protein